MSEKQVITSADVGTINVADLIPSKSKLLTKQEEKQLTRQIEDLTEENEEKLAPLRKKHEELTAQLAPIQAEILKNEAVMDTIKAPIRELHLKLRTHRKEQEKAEQDAKSKS